MNVIWNAFACSDWVGKIIVLVLLGCSLCVWALMSWKRGRLARVKRNNDAFLRGYMGSPHPMTLFLRSHGGKSFVKGMPIVEIYLATIAELAPALRRANVEEGALSSWQKGFLGPALSANALATVRAAAEGELSTQLILLEGRMGFIGTCASVAPSLGLLGTVWGIMVAFMGMVDASSSIVLSAVAPGISSALLTTVVGLLVSIPSSIGYNMLFDRVNERKVELENFADRLLADIERIHGAGTPAATAPMAVPFVQPVAQPVYGASAPAFAPSASTPPMERL